MENKELYVYLDLNGTLDQNFFQKDNIYFKMVNINTDTPLVQIGNYVFQGNYEDFLGTKVFFMEDKNHVQDTNVFIKETPIHLKYIAKTAKVIQLKWCKIPTNIVHVEQTECAELHFKESYNTVLEKLEKGALNIQDIVGDHCIVTTPIATEKPAEIKDTSVANTEEKLNVKEAEPVEMIEKQTAENKDFSKYGLLKDLAKMPVKQKNIKICETNDKLLAKAENADDFSILRQLFLQDVTLKNNDIEIGDCEFNKYVNVSQSIKDGVIIKIESDELSNLQKQQLLSADNFDNFTLPMKLTFLTEQLDEYKKVLETMEEKRLSEIDKYGRTFKDRYRLLKKLTKQIWYHVYQNYSD